MASSAELIILPKYQVNKYLDLLPDFIELLFETVSEKRV